MRLLMLMLLCLPLPTLAQDCELQARDLQGRMNLDNNQSLSLQRDLDRGSLICRQDRAQGELMLNDVRRQLDRQEAQRPLGRPGWDPRPGEVWTGAGPGADWD